MDSDDEPMVSVGRFTQWLHADSASSVAGTAIDSAQPATLAEHSLVLRNAMRGF